MDEIVEVWRWWWWEWVERERRGWLGVAEREEERVSIHISGRKRHGERRRGEPNERREEVEATTQAQPEPSLSALPKQRIESPCDDAYSHSEKQLSA